MTLTPAVFHILLALADEDRHGYGIMQDVFEQTGGAMDMGPGTLYGSIKRMLEAGLVEEAGEAPDPALGPGSGEERRRYYRITALGRKNMRSEAERLAAAVKVARARKVFAGVAR